MMGKPGLFHERPDIWALLPEGGDREPMAASEGLFGGWNVTADLVLNHRQPQCSPGVIVRGFDALDFKDSPERFLLFQPLGAPEHHFCP